MSWRPGSLAERAKRAYREDSLPRFLIRCLRFPVRSLTRAATNLVRYPRQHTWTIGETAATFHSESVEETRALQDTIGPERESIARLVESAKPGDVFFDVGAHLGVYSCFLGNAEDLDAIYAFEAHPKNAAKLERNLKINEVDADALDVALSNVSGHSELLIGAETTRGLEATLLQDTEPVEENRVEDVRVMTGDEFVAKRGGDVPNLIKIDVEGEEYEVLEGLESTLTDAECRVLYCEIHERGGVGDVQSRGHRGEDVLELIERFGFEVETLDIYPGGTQVLGRK